MDLNKTSDTATEAKKFSVDELAIQNTSSIFNYHFTRAPYRYSLFVENWITELANSLPFVMFKDADYYRSSSPGVPFRQKQHSIPQCIASSDQLTVKEEFLSLSKSKNWKLGLRTFSMKQAKNMDCVGTIIHMKNFVELIDSNVFQILVGGVEAMHQFEKNGMLSEYRDRYGVVFTELDKNLSETDQNFRLTTKQCYVGRYEETTQEKPENFVESPPIKKKGYNVYFSFVSKEQEAVPTDITCEKLDENGTQIHFVTSQDGTEDLTSEFIKNRFGVESKRLITKEFKCDHSLLATIPNTPQLVSPENSVLPYRIIYDSLIDVIPTDLQLARDYLISRFVTEFREFHNHPRFDKYAEFFTVNFSDFDPSFFIYVYRKLKLCPTLKLKCKEQVDHIEKQRSNLLELENFTVPENGTYIILKKMRGSVSTNDFDHVQFLDSMNKSSFLKCSKHVEELFSTKRKLKSNQLASEMKNWSNFVKKDPVMVSKDKDVFTSWAVEMTSPVFDEHKFIKFVSFVNTVLLKGIADYEMLFENPKMIILKNDIARLEKEVGKIETN